MQTLPEKLKSRIKEQTMELKSDYSLFRILFSAFQVREGDLEEFSVHENHPWTRALSTHGKLRLPRNNSELLECLGSCSSVEPPICDSKIVYGVVAVPSLAKCFYIW